MKTRVEQIAIECSFGWREFIDITRDGAALALDDYEFQLPFMAAGQVLAVATVTKDAGVTGRLWLELAAADAADLPEGRSSTGYLLVQDPDGNRDIAMHLPALARKGGPTWA